MNKLSIISVFLIALSTQSALLHADSSQSTFEKYMNQSITNGLYSKIQIKNLSTVLDYRLYRTLTVEDPVISKVTPDLELFLKEHMRMSLVKDLTDKSLVSQDSNSDIKKLATETMRRLGFSAEQIGNAKVYLAFGPVNAYTYGVDKNSVVIVIYKALLERATKGEVMGVIGHELGHVIKQHVLQSIQLNMMLERIINIALQHHPMEGYDDSTREKSREIVNKLFEEIETDRIHKSSIINGVSLLSKEEAAVMARQHMTTLRVVEKLLDKKIAIIHENMDPKILVQSSQLFLQEMVRAMNTMEVAEETKDFFIKLAQDLPSAYRPNIEDLITHLRVLKGVLSREQETTADMFGVSVVDPYKAVKFDLKVAGGAGLGNKPSKQEVKNAIGNIQKQLDTAKSSATKEELAINLSIAGESHPRHNIRAINQVLLSRNYQVVAMRNPFLRLVVLKEEADAVVKIIQTALIDQEMQLAELDKLFASKQIDQTVHLMNKTQMLKNKEKLVADFEAYKTVSQNVESDILKLINDLGFEKRNPRFDDYVDYLINEKEFEVALLEYFKSLKSQTKNASQLKYFEAKVQELLTTIESKNETLEKLKSGIEKKTSRTSIINAINSSKVDIEKLRKIRDQIRIDTKSLHRDSRAESEITLDDRKSSSLKSDANYGTDNVKEKVKFLMSPSAKCRDALSEIVNK